MNRFWIAAMLAFLLGMPLGAQTVALASPPDAVLSLPGPNVLMEIDEDKITDGQQFTVQLDAVSADGIDELT